MFYNPTNSRKTSAHPERTGRVALVTGFEPYNGAEVNPSGEIARRLHGTEIAGLTVVARVLPVSTATAPDALREAIDEVRPDVVMMLGVWPGRHTFQVERVALNVLDFPFADNDGATPADVPVLGEGPAAYLSTAPVKAVAAAWQDAGLPGIVSNSAGTYLCNQSYYVALDHAGTRGVPVVFVHIPTIPAEAARQSPPQPSLSLDTLEAGAKVALEALAAGSTSGGQPPTPARQTNL